MVVRAALWLLCLVLALIRVRSTGNFAWLAAIAVLAAGATTLDADRQGSLLRWVEGIAAGAAVVATNGADSPFLPYLFAPAFAAGIFRGPVAAVIPRASLLRP